MVTGQPRKEGGRWENLAQGSIVHHYARSIGDKQPSPWRQDGAETVDVLVVRVTRNSGKRLTVIPFIEERSSARAMGRDQQKALVFRGSADGTRSVPATYGTVLCLTASGFDDEVK